jgi:hypothetical protein
VKDQKLGLSRTCDGKSFVAMQPGRFQSSHKYLLCIEAPHTRGRPSNPGVDLPCGSTLQQLANRFGA